MPVTDSPSINSKSLQQRLMRPLIWSVLAAIVIYGGSIVIGDFEQFRESIAKLRLGDWCIVLGLSLLNYGARFVRWEFYLRRLRCRLPVFRSLAYYVGGFAFTTTPGKAGEAVRSLYLKRHGIGLAPSLAAFFAERFIDLVTLAFFALSAAFAFPNYKWPVMAITVLVLALLPFVHVRSFHDFLDASLRRISSSKVRSVGLRSVDVLRSASVLLRSGPLFVGIVLALIAWGAEGAAFHLILQILDVNVSLGLAAGIFSVSLLVGAVSFVPGGLGSTEAVMVVLLKLVGADITTAVAATIIWRLATLWFAVAIGAAVLAALEIDSSA